MNSELEREADTPMTEPNMTDRELELEDQLDQVMKERDHAESMADKLAAAVQEYFRVDVGEHSNLECPWTNAIAVLEGEYITDSDTDRKLRAALSTEAQVEKKA